MNSYEVLLGLEIDGMLFVLNFDASLKEIIAKSKFYNPETPLSRRHSFADAYVN
jgi:hypothetical protein